MVHPTKAGKLIGRHPPTAMLKEVTGPSDWFLYSRSRRPISLAAAVALQAASSSSILDIALSISVLDSSNKHFTRALKRTAG